LFAFWFTGTESAADLPLLLAPNLSWSTLGRVQPFPQVLLLASAFFPLRRELFPFPNVGPLFRSALALNLTPLFPPWV